MVPRTLANRSLGNQPKREVVAPACERDHVPG